ncbi:HAD family phosphatase [Fulvivirgaceae bacterium PWU4]|uniref:HAD family phosphatase n=1 Tax=Chryseosolibacter histidini TaxID=2782349 RepID=A0AAP2DGV7_9BACT|nr:HAD family phosphatase [Chryseosolibacter histidini]MBT1695374.1 HAD family phosphatase [Chryseosolibacter histidini]
MKRYKGFIFDMNGTMIDDMAYHELAWHDVLVNQLKAPLTREQVRRELYGKHDEMFYRIFGETRFTRAEIDAISFQKEQRYRDEFLPNLKLIDGLDSFLAQAKSRGIALSIGTAAPPENVDFVLDNLKIRHYFPVIVGQTDVKTSKPHPEVFSKAAALMNLPPEECLVFEDAPKGIEAAKRAGIDAVAVTSFHTAKELENDNVIATISNYNDAVLKALIS